MAKPKSTPVARKAGARKLPAVKKRAYVRKGPTQAEKIEELDRRLISVQNSITALGTNVAAISQEREANLSAGVNGLAGEIIARTEEVKLVHEIRADGHHRIITVTGHTVCAGDFVSREAIARNGEFRAATGYWDGFFPAGIFTVSDTIFAGLAS